QIQGYFNPRHDGDTYKGLGINFGIEGSVADNVIEGLPEFLAAAGRDYHIRKVPAGVFDPSGGVDDGGNVVPAWREVENQFHLARSSDGSVVSPHTVTDQYAPLSLMDIAEEIQPWFDSGFVMPDGVYSTRGGSLEILGLRVNDGDIGMPNGERFNHYIIFQNPHGSGGTAKGKIISWRIVCQNTFAAAAGAKAEFAITHRVAKGDHEMQREIMASRAKEAVAAWETVQKHFQKMGEWIDRTLAIPVGVTEAEALTDQLLGIADIAKASTRAKNRREAILQGFENNDLGTYGKSAWDWLNAVTSFTSNGVEGSKVTAEARLTRNVDPNGTGFKMEQKAEAIVAALG
ncbi:MAG: DUF945 domain-containing protein, partial [Candidatus Omnitrophica bacterium]|nr:DUF945 domain-containing protein [Candidatus Omnitrophota bacterium]